MSLASLIAILYPLSYDKDKIHAFPIYAEKKVYYQAYSYFLYFWYIETLAVA